MAQLNKAAYLSKYNTMFSTNGINAVTASNLREFIQDTKDSMPFFLDDAALMALTTYNPSRSYNPDQVVFNNGKLYVVTKPLTGTFDNDKVVELPVDPEIASANSWADDFEYETDNIVRWNWKLFRAIDDSTNVEPGSDGSKWEQINVRRSSYVLEYLSGFFYPNLDFTRYGGSILQRNGSGYSTDIDSEIADNKWIVVGQTVHAAKLEVPFSFLESVSDTEGDYEFIGALPAGAVPLNIKAKPQETFASIGSTTSATCQLYFGTYDVSRVLISVEGFQAVSATGGSMRGLANFTQLLNHEGHITLTCRVKINSGMIYELSAGQVTFWVSYLILKL